MLKKQFLFILMLQTMSIASLYSSSSIDKAAFRRACRQNKTEEVERILERNNQSTCEELLNTKFIKYIDSSLKDCPLFLAIKNQNLELINILLAYGANPNIIDGWNDNTPLTQLFQTRECSQITAITQALLNAGADPNIKDSFGNTSLEAFVYDQKEHPQMTTIIKALIDAGANPNRYCDNNHTSLHIAAEIKNIEVIRRLLKHNADPNAQVNVIKDTPLTLLLKNNSNEYLEITAIPKNSLASTVEELLAAGANPFLKNTNKQNVISYAK
ncbi:ankyrin repeat domain-containing protein, partial [Candidatus Babeliales bacterium]|nr:ankyrin repeat domain-containing protein [Candidatus Babeliales bacterium]